MSGQIWDEGDPTTCWDCGAKHGGGEPFHQMKCIHDGALHFEYRCETCADHHARCLWPEDDWGPYPGMPIPPIKGRPS